MNDDRLNKLVNNIQQIFSKGSVGELRDDFWAIVKVNINADDFNEVYKDLSNQAIKFISTRTHFEPEELWHGFLV